MGDRVRRRRVPGFAARRRAERGAGTRAGRAQAAPPDKVGPALHHKQTPSAKIKRDETTGAAPKELKPSHGDDATPGKLEKHAPSR